MSHDRQSGRSTKQIREAPRDAVFIVPTYQTIGYYRDIARRWYRLDIRIEPPNWLETGWMGNRRPLVIDHAAFDFITSDRQWESIRRLRERGL